LGTGRSNKGEVFEIGDTIVGQMELGLGGCLVYGGARWVGGIRGENGDGAREEGIEGNK